MKFYLAQVDLMALFIWGFTFLIAAIDLKMGLGYMFFIIIGGIGLGLHNGSR